VTLPAALAPPLALLLAPPAALPLAAPAVAEDELGELLHAEAATAVAASSTPTA
jgi:hypothetical protein